MTTLCIACNDILETEEDMCFHEQSGQGPFCEICLSYLNCGICNGEGRYRIKRNSTGDIDYLDGSPAEEIECPECDGFGILEY